MYKYQKIKPEIMKFLNSYTDWIPSSITGGVAQVYQFELGEIREKIPSNVSRTTVRKALTELFEKGEVHWWGGDLYSSQKALNQRFRQRTVKHTSPPREDPSFLDPTVEEHITLAVKAVSLCETLSRYNVSAYRRKMVVSQNDEKVQNVIVIAEKDFNDFEAFLRTRAR